MQHHEVGTTVEAASGSASFLTSSAHVASMTVEKLINENQILRSQLSKEKKQRRQLEDQLRKQAAGGEEQAPCCRCSGTRKSTTSASASDSCGAVQEADDGKVWLLQQLTRENDWLVDRLATTKEQLEKIRCDETGRASSCATDIQSQRGCSVASSRIGEAELPRVANLTVEALEVRDGQVVVIVRRSPNVAVSPGNMELGASVALPLPEYLDVVRNTAGGRR